MQIYDTIGHGYKNLRQPDPRIAQQILNALGDASSIVNVGAGAGSYEPIDRSVTAVEPSITMIQQRPVGSANVVQATAEALPFRDTAFDSALAVLTLHHWSDKKRGLDELGRTVRNKIVIFTFDPAAKYAWLIDYFPELPKIDEQSMPTLSEIEKHFGKVKIIDVPIPHDCTDGFLCAYWRRPRAYFDPRVRAAISSFAKMEKTDEGLAQLKEDLDSGAWEKKYGKLMQQTELDVGYRLVIAEPNG